VLAAEGIAGRVKSGNIFIDKPYKYAKIEFDWNLDSPKFLDLWGLNSKII